MRHEATTSNGDETMLTTITDTDGVVWKLITHTAKTALLRSLDNSDSYALANKFRGIGDNLSASVELMFGTINEFKASIEDAFKRFDSHTDRMCQ